MSNVGKHWIEQARTSLLKLIVDCPCLSLVLTCRLRAPCRSSIYKMIIRSRQRAAHAP